MRMTLTMMFLRSFVDMVKVRPEDLDYIETGTIGWTLSVKVQKRVKTPLNV